MRHKDDNKSRLIRQKAMEMIVKDGFDGFSMQKLAKAVEISPATIYIYFESREDMLTKLYNEMVDEFEKDALTDFDPGMPFAEGLWLLWQNRYRNIMKDPLRYYFWEQFRNSPLINHKGVTHREFGIIMRQFVQNAIANNELRDLPIDVYWAIAYSPLYTLIKFGIEQKDHAGNPYVLDEPKMQLAFSLVLKALQCA